MKKILLICSLLCLVQVLSYAQIEELGRGEYQVNNKTYNSYIELEEVFSTDEAALSRFNRYKRAKKMSGRWLIFAGASVLVGYLLAVNTPRKTGGDSPDWSGIEYAILGVAGGIVGILASIYNLARMPQHKRASIKIYNSSFDLSIAQSDHSIGPKLMIGNNGIGLMLSF